MKPGKSIQFIKIVQGEKSLKCSYIGIYRYRRNRDKYGETERERGKERMSNRMSGIK